MGSLLHADDSARVVGLRSPYELLTLDPPSAGIQKDQAQTCYISFRNFPICVVLILVAAQGAVFGCIQVPMLLDKDHSPSPHTGAAVALCSTLLVLSFALCVRLACIDPGQLPTAAELRRYACGAGAVSDEVRRARKVTEALYSEVFGNPVGFVSHQILDLAARPPSVEGGAPGDRLSHGNSLNWCRTCCVWRPPGCSHCSICGRCCLGFDHHCYVLGRCVGRRNRCTFFALCWCAGAVSLGLASLSLAELASWFPSALVPPLEHPAIAGATLHAWGIKAFAAACACVVLGACNPRFVGGCCNASCWRRSLACLALLPGGFLVALAIHMRAQRAMEAAMVGSTYTLACAGLSCPFIVLAAFEQCDNAARGWTVKQSVVAQRSGERRPPPVLRNLLEFSCSPLPPSLLASRGMEAPGQGVGV